MRAATPATAGNAPVVRLRDGTNGLQTTTDPRAVGIKREREWERDNASIDGQHSQGGGGGTGPGSSGGTTNDSTRHTDSGIGDHDTYVADTSQTCVCRGIDGGGQDVERQTKDNVRQAKGGKRGGKGTNREQTLAISGNTIGKGTCGRTNATSDEGVPPRTLEGRTNANTGLFGRGRSTDEVETGKGRENGNTGVQTGGRHAGSGEGDHTTAGTFGSKVETRSSAEGEQSTGPGSTTGRDMVNKTNVVPDQPTAKRARNRREKETKRERDGKKTNTDIRTGKQSTLFQMGVQKKQTSD